MEYTVVIRKEHCVGANYFNNKDCPLYRAIKEQLPHLKKISVGGWYVRFDMDKWNFQEEKCNEKSWCSGKMHALLNDYIEEHSVTFTSPNHLEEQSEANLKEASKIIEQENVFYTERVAL